MDPTTFKYLSAEEIKIIEKDITQMFKNTDASQRQDTQQFEPNIVRDQKKINYIDSFASKYALSASKVNLTQPDDKRIQTELQYYKKDVADNELSFSIFWKKNCSKFPQLASAVRRYFIIPASSVAAESAFSEANFIQRKERSSLSSKNLRYSLILKSVTRSSIYKDLNH